MISYDYMQKIKYNNGFSILEITISIFIISMAFIGLMSLTGQNIQAQYTNENSLIASQLAQEGLELVRNIRDSNWISGQPHYYDNIYKDSDDTYIVAYTPIGATDFGPDTIDDPGAKLYINSSGNYDHDSSGVPTPFYRLITVVTTAKNEYLEVECKVKWNERGKNNEYTAKTLLYAWR